MRGTLVALRMKLVRRHICPSEKLPESCSCWSLEWDICSAIAKLDIKVCVDTVVVLLLRLLRGRLCAAENEGSREHDSAAAVLIEKVAPVEGTLCRDC